MYNRALFILHKIQHSHFLSPCHREKKYLIHTQKKTISWYAKLLDHCSFYMKSEDSGFVLSTLNDFKIKSLFKENLKFRLKNIFCSLTEQWGPGVFDSSQTT